jgi:alanine racemase
MNASISSIARHINADYHAGAKASDSNITTLLTDSRSLFSPAESLFFALRTPTGNGHSFVEQLYYRGVRNFVVQELPSTIYAMPEANFLVVDDTLEALRRVGGMARSCRAKVVAITGSRGKTTLKEWLFQLLSSPSLRVARSPRSYNSQIGVPLSLWEIEPDTDIAVIEAGISQRGEMNRLAEIIKPDVVIFTNIYGDHDEGFSSREEKMGEKARLASLPVTKNVIYSADQKGWRELLDTPSVSWSFSDGDAPIYIIGSEETAEGLRVRYRYGGVENTLSVPVKGAGALENSLHALALLLTLGYAHEEINRRFALLRPIDTRLNVSEGVNGCSIIYDGYTADIPSLLPALDFMRRREVKGQTHTLILSDIAEGGMDSPLYAKIATLMRNAGIDRFIGVGEALAAHKHLFRTNSLFFRTTEECMATLSTSDFSNEIILIKGAPEYEFSRIAENLEARKHETVMHVNLDALVRNFNHYKEHLPAGTKITAMVKASAYGLGSYEISKTLQSAGAAYLAVAVLDEGAQLREQGITMPIMVMNPKVVNYKSLFANRLEPEIYSLEMLRDVVREAEKNGVTEYPVHLKLDTGMHRTGFIASELEEVAEILCRQNFVVAASAFSHLATADCLDMDEYTLRQIERFSEMTEYLLQRLPYRFIRHILNSAGIIRFPQYAFDMARLGIGLYGVNTLEPPVVNELSVVASLRTVVISVREWEAGEAVGYSRKGALTRRSRIATIPIGYADGMNRKFGNGTIKVLVNGKEAPTIGNICMDACMIDVTDVDCKVGDEVEIFGDNIPLQRLADTLGTIPYEVLTSISPRVKRIYFRE